MRLYENDRRRFQRTRYPNITGKPIYRMFLRGNGVTLVGSGVSLIGDGPRLKAFGKYLKGLAPYMLKTVASQAVPKLGKALTDRIEAPDQVEGALNHLAQTSGKAIADSRKRDANFAERKASELISKGSQRILDNLLSKGQGLSNIQVHRD